MHGVIGTPSIALAISEMIPAKFRRLLDEVAAKHGFEPPLLISNYQWARLVRARHELVFRARTEIRTRDGKPLAWSELGRLMNRDHTTVIYAYRQYVARSQGELYRGHRRHKDGYKKPRYLSEEAHAAALAHDRAMHRKRLEIDPYYRAMIQKKREREAAR